MLKHNWRTCANVLLQCIEFHWKRCAGDRHWPKARLLARKLLHSRRCQHYTCIIDSSTLRLSVSVVWTNASRGKAAPRKGLVFSSFIGEPYKKSQLRNRDSAITVRYPIRHYSLNARRRNESDRNACNEIRSQLRRDLPRAAEKCKISRCNIKGKGYKKRYDESGSVHRVSTNVGKA